MSPAARPFTAGPSWQDRDALSAGFYRIASDDRNAIQIYPDGFLPLIAPDVTDISAAFGASWRLGEWDMDSSLTYGRNEMDYDVRNSLNRSLGTASKTHVRFRRLRLRSVDR